MFWQRGLFVHLLVTGIVTAVYIQGDAGEEPDTQLAQAHAHAVAANRKQKEKEFDQAADLYEQAVAICNQVLTNDPENPQAKKQLQHSRSGLTYCLAAPLNEQLNKARAVADTSPVEGSQALIALGEQFAKAFERCDDKALRNNRDFCYIKSGVYPIKKGDVLRAEGKFREAAEMYRAAITNYQTVHARLGKPVYQGNLDYAQQFNQQCTFQQAVLDHGPAPAFELSGQDPPSVRLADFSNQVVLLFFWTSWCGNCEQLFPVLERCKQDYSERGFTPVGICLDRIKGWDKGDIKRAEKRMQSLDFINVWGDSSTVESYGAPEGVPFLVWVGRDGKLVRVGVEGDDRATQIPATIQELLGRPQ